ncbi:tRNA (guanine-N(1)-)-methyltransferase [Piscirickettsia salmonis]|uniref:tRNA (guanine-N(1)-)-methyltransferase n=1 Tax=Piscirickettsia salmonis TaxID=1238 RepID=A0A9Q6PSL8_PISSA|nr:tRNA (guanosine(37)-N1)-methyltransferase TrmD [Piscirickettsia salmonis]QGN94981.1 tRNA (guanine-N(1)-)-methyltransferase [Piscirickettsia salmonis]QGO06069.1 tRNA (guanine-N(1)-)-methyltransferase [Piscirickettsia salmonis]QGO34395.1 tRNA (guanine-N(1)-)-methyltransferase [Piscirickettsia salmonis]QGO38001.1 tRNA (guanine-N(1)-)-methyltransferase [Piscirickettsia salmonis]QGO41629.1 tRNA (guanine-N(1)-)-methyltransferase [Piscirickettsia salmonis]
MNICVVSLFAEMFQAITHYGVTGRAVQQQAAHVSTVNPREFTQDIHRTVDDRPYGGGPGMLMKVQPLRDAIVAARKKTSAQAPVIYLSPQGAPLTQSKVLELAKQPELILLAGRYEGIDERVIEANVDEEISLGDYVLSGGELPAMVLMDAIIRVLPGVLGDAESFQQDSFMAGLLDYPHYTRPELIDGRQVPEVLMSGHHEKIERWREQQALGRTYLRRPDLFERLALTAQQQMLLDEYLAKAAGCGSASDLDKVSNS